MGHRAWTGGAALAAALVAVPAAPQDVTLTLTLVGSGGGSVASEPAGLDCAASCTFDVASGTTLELLPTASPEAVFEGFGGDPDCEDGQLFLDAAKTCIVSFEALITLRVATSGKGTASILSAPPGIDCGETCEAQFKRGTSVRLRAKPDETTRLVGWAGACSDGGDVRLLEAATCEALLELLPPALPRPQRFFTRCEAPQGEVACTETELHVDFEEHQAELGEEQQEALCGLVAKLLACDQLHACVAGRATADENPKLFLVRNDVVSRFFGRQKLPGRRFDISPVCEAPAGSGQRVDIYLRSR